MREAGMPEQRGGRREGPTCVRAFDEAQMSRSATNCNRIYFRTCALGITWEGTPVPDFAGTVAVAAAMLFMLAVTLGLVSPSPRSVEAAQTIAQKN